MLEYLLSLNMLIMKIKLGNYLFGDEAMGYQYPGEKTDEQKLQALHDRLRVLVNSCSDYYDDLRYASGYDLGEIEYLEEQCAVIRDRIARLRELADFEQFPIEPEVLSDAEKDEIYRDMQGAVLLTEALANDSKKMEPEDTRKGWRTRVGREDRTRSFFSKRGSKRKKARKESRTYKEAA